jgi:hypothetical protein
MITWEFATAADVLAFLGETPNETLRAVVVRMDEMPVGMIGMVFEGGRMRAFSEYREELAPHLTSMPVLRAIKAAQRMFAQSQRPVIAVRECSSEILERVGFRQIDGDLYLFAVPNFPSET